MNQQRWIGLTIGLFALLSIVAGWWGAPWLLGSLPVRVQSRLPESLYAVVRTPVPAALPAPLVSPAEMPPIINIPATIESSLGELDDGFVSAAIGPEAVANSAVINEGIVPPTPTSLPEPADIYPDLPVATSIHGFEVIAQEFNNCGPANLSMVLNYFGYQSDQMEIGDRLKPNYEDRNVSPHELVSYVGENTSMRAVAFRGGDLLLLKRLLAAGFPVIIEKGLWLDRKEGWMGHYLTLTGYDDGQESFLSMDTFLGPWDDSGRLVSYEEVSDKWHQFNNVFIVVFAPDQEQELYALLPVELSDPATMWQQAALSAQAMLQENDADAFTWFNLAASLTHLGELTGDVSHFDSAAIAFDRAREIGLPWRMLWYQFEPYQAYLVAGRINDVKLLTEVILIYEGGRNIEETYLYRGHALLAAGDRDGAGRAYRSALRLNPSMTAALTALDVLE